jgi:phosphonate metabolism protein (transferase hexapeptide repeat family)
MLIDCGNSNDPWISGRPLSEAPEIDPTAVVRQSEFGCYTYVGPHSNIAETVLGDYSYAIGRNFIDYAQIGKFCNIASDVRINPGNHPWWRATLHHFTYRSRSYGFALDDDADFFQWRRDAQVVIGPDVWIGHGAVIMPGVKISTGAGIGSGSVVTKDVPPYAIVAGVPARLLRFRVDEATAEKLQRIAWWDWSHAEIEAALPDLRALDAAAFAEKYDR